MPKSKLRIWPRLNQSRREKMAYTWDEKIGGVAERGGRREGYSFIRPDPQT